MALLTTTTGAFPKPAALRRARRDFAAGTIDEAALRHAEDAAQREIVALQESAGLDVLTDGQVDRGDMVAYFGERLDGVEAGGWVRCWDNRYYRRPVVTGEVSRPGPISVARWRAARDLAKRPVKAVITGPYTMMDWSFDEHYADRAACCLAFAEALGDEARDLAAAGARELQIDEPAISGRPHEMAFLGRALARVTRDLDGDVRVWLRTAYGDVRPVLGALFVLPVHGLAFELANSRLALVDALAALPQDKSLGAGVLDVLAPSAESVDTVRERIERLLASVPAERLVLQPDADLRGFDLDEAGRRLATLIEAAGSFTG